MPARTSSAVATFALRCFPGCRYHAFSGNESNEASQAKMLAFSFDEREDCMHSIQNGAGAMVDECQRSEESENMLAYSHLTSKETVRKAYKSRCAPRRSSPAFLSPRPSPPSPLPWKAWKTGWPLIQDVTSPQRPASRTATQPRLPCLRSQGTSTTSEDSKFVVYRNTTGT